MSQKWYQKASIQTAIISGVFLLIVAIISGIFGIYSNRSIKIKAELESLNNLNFSTFNIDNEDQSIIKSNLIILLEQLSTKVLAATQTEKIHISIGNFVYNNSRIGGFFSRYLQYTFQEILEEQNHFQTLSRNELLFQLNEMPWLVSEICDPNNEFQINNLHINIYILKGRFRKIENNLELIVLIVNHSTGEKYSEKVLLPINIFKKYYDIIPKNIDEENKIIQAYESIIPNAKYPKFDVKIWPGLGNSATYIEGDSLTLFFYSTRDCYIRVYHCGANGKFNFLFPHQHENSFIEAEKIYRIPNYETDFAFLITEPFGVEKVVLVASLKEFSDNPKESDFLECEPQKINKSINRGIKRIDKDLLTSSTCIFTTVKDSY